MRGAPWSRSSASPQRLGAVLGISTTAAKKLVGHALEVRHRLPRLWAQVQAGRVPAWRARMVAETTIHATPALTADAAAFVDAQVAAVAGRVGTAQIDRLVAEAIKRFDLAQPDPASDPEDGYLHVNPRHVTVHKEDVHFAGTVRIEAELDVADAWDVEHAVAHGAAAQKALGSTASRDTRRAAALGDLARTQTTLDLFNQEGQAAEDDGVEARGVHPEEPRDEASRRARTSTTETSRESPNVEPGEPAAEDGHRTCRPPAKSCCTPTSTPASRTEQGVTVFGPTGRLEEGQRLLLLDQLRSWCTDSRTRITIKPVIDLNADLSTTAYAVPDRIRDQVILRDGTCVFPWCTRPARRCDIDREHEAVPLPAAA